MSECTRTRQPEPERSPLIPAALHGTLAGYRAKGCRCADCTKAATNYQRGYRQRSKDSTVDSTVDFGDHVGDCPIADPASWLQRSHVAKCNCGAWQHNRAATEAAYGGC